jgi:hypothetical protein
MLFFFFFSLFFFLLDVFVASLSSRIVKVDYPIDNIGNIPAWLRTCSMNRLDLLQYPIDAIPLPLTSHACDFKGKATMRERDLAAGISKSTHLGNRPESPKWFVVVCSSPHQTFKDRQQPAGLHQKAHPRWACR